jgi:hypothetical protein
LLEHEFMLLDGDVDSGEYAGIENNTSVMHERG